MPHELKEPWERALELLRGDARINKPTFEAHFRAISPVSHTPCGQVAAAPDAITLAVPAAFTRNWLEDRHLAPLCEAMTAVLGREVSVRLVVFGDWLKTAQGAAA